MTTRPRLDHRRRIADKLCADVHVRVQSKFSWNRQLKCFVFTVVHFGFIFFFREDEKKRTNFGWPYYSPRLNPFWRYGIYSVSTRFSFAFDDDERVGPAPTHTPDIPFRFWPRILVGRYTFSTTMCISKLSWFFFSLSLSLVTCCTQRYAAHFSTARPRWGSDDDVYL